MITIAMEHRSRRTQRWLRRLTSASLVGLALVFAYPFAWMALSVVKSNREIFDPRQFWPRTWDFEPALRLMSGEWFPFWRVLANSLFVAGMQTLLATVLTALAGYTFATSRNRSLRLLFPIALLVIVLPPAAMAVPIFTWIGKLHLFDSLAGVVLPGAVSGIGVIWFTQVFRQIPPALREAARMDGAGEWRVWWTLLPVVRPALIGFGMLHFILAWHDHLLPLLLLNSPENQTLQVALAALYGSSLRFPYAALMAGSVISLLPTFVLFAVCYRRFKTALADVLMH